MGNAIVPAALLADLVARGAKVRFVGGPEDVAAVEGYRPSAALDRFVRARDLTCRMPGCDRPAMHADIDHTRPYPYGPTHPSNTKCYCRFHHLLKTFWPGWTDRQEPDGTVHVTTPTGRTYTTKPFSALLFPGWNTTTAPLQDAPLPPPPTAGRGAKMPTRTRSREQSREYRITQQRRLNAIQRELDHAAAQAAAAERAAKRAQKQNPTQNNRPATTMTGTTRCAHPDTNPTTATTPHPSEVRMKVRMTSITAATKSPPSECGAVTCVRH